jgi:hypothetical protein
MPTIPFGAVKTSRDFSFVFSAHSPDLKFAVIENFTFRNEEGPLTTACLTGCTGPSTFQMVQFSNWVIYLLHICIIFHILWVFVFMYRGKWKEELPLVFIQGKGLKIDTFEFSTCSLGLPISNPEGFIFRPFSCTLAFCSFVFGPPFYIGFTGFHHFQAFFCVRLFSTCSKNTIIKTTKSIASMPTTSFLKHYFP